MMESTLFKHILIRTFLGLIPHFLFAMIIFSIKQSGNDFLGTSFVKMILGFGSLTIWSIWMLTESVGFYVKKQTSFAYGNLALLLASIGMYVLELYINHIYN
jgi:hypothetical protein